MDILAEILEGARLSSTIHCPVVFSAPWAVRIGKQHGAGFLIVIEGNCQLLVEGVAEIAMLRTGDFAIIRQGFGYSIQDAPNSPVVQLADFIALGPTGPAGTWRLGEGGAQTIGIGGRFFLDDDGLNPLLRALPPVILVRREQRASVDWLSHTLEAIASEAQSGRPGSEAVITRLSDILFIQALRVCLTDSPNGSGGWFKALADAQLGPVLREVHRRPNTEWTVARMASESAMSRSAFAARFQTIVGEPPLQYVTRWRMHRAGNLLRRTGDSLESVASQVGYESEASFSKAFKRWIGQSPGAYRRLGARSSLPAPGS